MHRSVTGVSPVATPLMAAITPVSVVEVEVGDNQDYQVENEPPRRHRLNIQNAAVLIHARLKHLSAAKVRLLIKQEVDLGLTDES